MIDRYECTVLCLASTEAAPPAKYECYSIIYLLPGQRVLT